MKHKVENHNDLAKDTSSGAVINTNRTAFASYKKSKNARLNDKKKIASLEVRLARMESMIEGLVNGRD